MNKHKLLGPALAGFGAGAVNGLFGIGGGMILIPLLGLLTDWEDEKIFASSLSIILPICLVTLIATGLTGPIDWRASIPYLIGSGVGGVLSAHSSFWRQLNRRGLFTGESFHLFYEYNPERRIGSKLRIGLRFDTQQEGDTFIAETIASSALSPFSFTPSFCLIVFSSSSLRPLK